MRARRWLPWLVMLSVLSLPGCGGLEQLLGIEPGRIEVTSAAGSREVTVRRGESFDMRTAWDIGDLSAFASEIAYDVQPNNFDVPSLTIAGQNSGSTNTRVEIPIDTPTGEVTIGGSFRNNADPIGGETNVTLLIVTVIDP